MQEIRPIDIKRETIASLRELRVMMSTAQYRALIRTSNLATRREAARQMLVVADAYQELLKTRIDSIRGKLEANASDLMTANKNLKESVKQLDDLSNTLKTIAKFLDSVGKVINVIL